MDQHPRTFFVLEGIDGCGKSTHADLLAQRLAKYGYNTFLTCEPSRGRIGKLLREYLQSEVDVPRSIMLPLLIADRYDHQREISEKLYGERPHIVVCDRYVLSTMAYQFLAVGPERLDIELCRKLHGLDKIIPPTTIFLDIDVQEAERRLAIRGIPKQFYEKRLKEIAAGYMSILENRLDEAFGIDQKIHVVDGHGTIEQVAERIDDVIFEFLN